MVVKVEDWQRDQQRVNREVFFQRARNNCAERNLDEHYDGRQKYYRQHKIIALHSPFINVQLGPHVQSRRQSESRKVKRSLAMDRGYNYCSVCSIRLELHRYVV